MIVYIKPSISLFILLMFSWEYLYLLIIFKNIYFHFNTYLEISIKRFDISDASLFQIWIEISKLKAFSKAYLILSKKRMRLQNILFGLFIFIVALPYKFLKLCYYFLVTNKHCFRKGLEIYYTNLYYMLKESKIEVFNRNIYLNCYTLGKLIFELNCKNLTKQQVYNGIWEIRAAQKNFDDYEKKNQEYVELNKTIAKDHNNKIIYTPHYAYVEKNNTMHATSKVPSKIHNTQQIDSPLPSLILETAQHPASIITPNVHCLQKMPNRVWVPTYELFSVKYNHLDFFDLSKEDYKYQYEKTTIFHEILLNNKFSTNPRLITNLRTNLYAHILLNLTNKDITEAVESFNNDHND